MEESNLKQTEPEIQLSAEEKNKINQLTSQIQLKDPNEVLGYGSQAQAKVAEFADSVLAEIKAKDAGYAGDLLNNLLIKIKDLDLGSMGEGGSTISKIPLIGRLFDKSRNLLGKFEDIHSKMDKIVDELHTARVNLTKDITLLQALYDKNLEYFKDIQLYILAGSQKIQEVKEKLIPELKAKAESNKDSLASQEYQDMVQSLDRFEKKIHDLKLSRMLSLQTGPQIRLVQNGNQLLVEKIQSSILNTIPLWKSQIIIALGIFRQRKALEAQKEVSATTNDLIQKNAELLKMGTIEIAQESEKGIVEIETLKKVNSDLIETIQETLKIQEQGRVKRREVETELIQLEKEVKSSLLISR
jgi:uncharacterized protein YaaN involved in tellurite resistance